MYFGIAHLLDYPVSYDREIFRFADYDEDARFHTEERAYRGKREIREFFTRFLASLPPGATKRFALRALVIDGDLAFITWAVAPEVPLGTDTFVVRRGRIVRQTFVMHVAP
jgi:hypothetical protein